MTNLNNKNSSIYLAETFRNSLDTNSIYFYVSKSFNWDSEKYEGIATDSNPPEPDGSYLEEREIQETLIGAKRVLTQDSVFTCKNNQWTSGDVYDMYRDDYSESLLSATGASSLDEALYFVVTDELKVYICLLTPETPSTVKPTSTTTSIIKSSDGYWWKFLYSITLDNFNLFSTNSYIPCFVNETVSNFALANSGAVYVSAITDATTTNTPGTFFTRILGDGSDGILKFTINSTSISTGEIISSEIITNGLGYNTAFVDLSNCKDSLLNLQNNTGTTYNIENASIKIIIPPYIGHGYDPIYDLGASNIIITKQINTADVYIIPNNTEYRITGIIENPLNINNNVLTQSLISGCDRVIFPIDTTDDYTIGEIVSQGNSKGRVISWDSTNKILYYYKNFYTDNLNYNKFSGNTAIIGETSTTSLTPDITRNAIVNFIKFVNGYAYSDIKKYSGRINYINFIEPVIRNANQIETLSLVVEF